MAKKEAKVSRRSRNNIEGPVVVEDLRTGKESTSVSGVYQSKEHAFVAMLSKGLDTRCHKLVKYSKYYSLSYSLTIKNKKFVWRSWYTKKGSAISKREAVKEFLEDVCRISSKEEKALRDRLKKDKFEVRSSKLDLRYYLKRKAKLKRSLKKFMEKENG